jgi:hypothetical protein
MYLGWLLVSVCPAEVSRATSMRVIFYLLHHATRVEQIILVAHDVSTSGKGFFDSEQPSKLQKSYIISGPVSKPWLEHPTWRDKAARWMTIVSITDYLDCKLFSGAVTP